MENAKLSGRRSGSGTALGTLILARRTAAGLTLDQLATELGVSKSYLSRLERGTYAHPSPRVVNQLVNRLGISVEDAYAVTGYTLPQDLPNFGPYLRAKHGDWPDDVVRELESFYEFMKYKHSLS